MSESKGLGNVLKKLLKIQMELKAPKNQHCDYGDYDYRSCEDILQGVKPLCEKYQCTIFLSDSIKMIGDRYYVEATATIFDAESEESFVTIAYAREEDKKDRMDRSQTTGSASSYARKYALNGLLAIDDVKDSDGLPQPKPEPKPATKSAPKKTEYKPVQKPATPTSSAQYTQQENATKTITPAQRTRLFALGVEEDIRAVLKEYKIEHTTDIPMSKYDEICKKVEEKKNARDGK